ncbi:interleukin-7 receptor subunit alpha isoform X1 [Aquarana catesbeiana]|uniref:interleukin-7 receptor subunit alpha isoform X1 n=1 Tax=Aquarana catesbeiana TaxID=8400 RepID=UPI003CCA36E8
MYISAVGVLCLLVGSSLGQSGDSTDTPDDDDLEREMKTSGNFECFSKLRLHETTFTCIVTERPYGTTDITYFNICIDKDCVKRKENETFKIDGGKYILRACIRGNCRNYNIYKIAIPDPPSLSICYNNQSEEYIFNITAPYKGNEYLKDKLIHEVVIREEGAHWPICGNGRSHGRYKMCWRNTHIQVPKRNLEYSTTYEARVRSKPTGDFFDGSWSDWSEIVHFVTIESKENDNEDLVCIFRVSETPPAPPQTVECFTSPAPPHNPALLQSQRPLATSQTGNRLTSTADGTQDLRPSYSQTQPGEEGFEDFLVVILCCCAVVVIFILVIVLTKLFWKDRIKPFIWPELPDHKNALEKLCISPTKYIHISFNPDYFDNYNINKVDYMKAQVRTEDNLQVSTTDTELEKQLDTNGGNNFSSPAMGVKESSSLMSHSGQCSEPSDHMAANGTREINSLEKPANFENVLLPSTNSSSKCIIPNDSPETPEAGTENFPAYSYSVKQPNNALRGICWEDISMYIAMSAFKTPNSTIKQSNNI